MVHVLDVRPTPQRLTPPMQDPFAKLRPPPPTPEDEVCRCPSLTAIMLRDSLGPCPFYCCECNGEVAPERIPIDMPIAEQVSSWLSVEDALYRLWLDSGDYEEMAARALSDPTGTVNILGRQLADTITDRGLRTYHWWFLADPDAPLTACPCCSAPLSDWPTGRFRFCEHCRIIL